VQYNPFSFSKPLNSVLQLSSSAMTVIHKSIEINAPISEVFTYFARPEHMADQFPENMGLNVIPVEVKNGFGVGTIFRISGDFDGKKLQWDCETIDYVPMRKIVAKMIEGPFKSWQITVEFEELLLRVKALLEGTGSIPVYITLDAYRQILKEKERFNCSVSEAIVKIIQRSQQQQQTARTV
jgi:uncharacterized protein YndB with AHSA1/START domain